MKDFAPGLISKARVFEIEKWLPRIQTSLSLSMRAKEGGKEKTCFASRFSPFLDPPALRHQSLACHSHFALSSSVRKTKRLRRRLEK